MSRRLGCHISWNYEWCRNNFETEIKKKKNERTKQELTSYFKWLFVLFFFAWSSSSLSHDDNFEISVFLSISSSNSASTLTWFSFRHSEIHTQTFSKVLVLFLLLLRLQHLHTFSCSTFRSFHLISFYFSFFEGFLQTR